jgi:hypothetical protein
MNRVLVSKDSLKQMLDAAGPAKLQHIVGRALVVLFNNQTQGERTSNTVAVDNGIGFTGADGRTGCLTAKFYLANKCLNEWQVNAWIRKDKKGYPRICKYHKQINEAAMTKAHADATAKIIAAADAEQQRAIANANTTDFNEDWKQMKNQFAQREAQQEQVAFERGMDVEEHERLHQQYLRTFDTATPAEQREIVDKMNAIEARWA